eukprot:4852901-Pyramimonas_sp.AAC.1
MIEGLPWTNRGVRRESEGGPKGVRGGARLLKRGLVQKVRDFEEASRLGGHEGEVVLKLAGHLVLRQLLPDLRA